MWTPRLNCDNIQCHIFSGENQMINDDDLNEQQSLLKKNSSLCSLLSDELESRSNDTID